MDKRQQRIGYIQIFITGCLWGTIGLFVTIMTGMGADGSLISLLRIGSALIMMFFLVLTKSGGIPALRVDRKTIALTMVMGILGQAVFNLCYAKAIQIAGVATGAVLLYTAPIFVFLIATLFFRERPTIQKLVALAANIAGCVLTVTGGNFATLSFAAAGVIMGVLAGFFYALSTVFSKLAANRAHPYVLTFYTFLFATLFLFAIQLRQGFQTPAISPKLLLMGAAFGLVSTVLAYAFYMNGLAKPVETSKVPIIASVETVVATLLGTLLFHEDIGLWKLIGIGLVLASIAIMNLSVRDESPISDTTDG